jgi:hypothetical protein
MGGSKISKMICANITKCNPPDDKHFDATSIGYGMWFDSDRLIWNHPGNQSNRTTLAHCVIGIRWQTSIPMAGNTRNDAETMAGAIRAVLRDKMFACGRTLMYFALLQELNKVGSHLFNIFTHREEISARESAENELMAELHRRQEERRKLTAQTRKEGAPGAQIETDDDD